MAKVSARGCIALAQYRVDRKPDHDPSPYSSDITYYVKLVLRSDGTILSGNYSRHHGRHGWNSGSLSVWGRLKPEVTAKGREEMRAAFARVVARRWPAAYPVDAQGRRIGAEVYA